MVKWIALVALELVAHSAFAFTLNTSTNSGLQGWDNPEVQFAINTSNCPASVDVIGAFNDAAKLWNGLATSRLKVVYGGATTSTTFASPPTVYCETNFAAVTGLDQDFTVGAGAIQTSNGRIYRGLLILNVSTGLGNISGENPTMLRVILAHEIGHVLGLGHAEDSSALMYFDASAKRNVALSQDDIDGMTYLYPRDELSGDTPMGCGLVATPPSGGPRAGLLALSLLALVWFAMRIPVHRRFA